MTITIYDLIRMQRDLKKIKLQVCCLEEDGILSSANNGLSLNGAIAVLGQNVGEVGDPAALISDREIPMDGNSISFTNGNILIGPTTDTGQKLQVSGVTEPTTLALFGESSFFSPYVEIHEPRPTYTVGTIGTARGASLFVNRESIFSSGLTLPSDYYSLNVYNSLYLNSTLTINSLGLDDTVNAASTQVNNIFRRAPGAVGFSTVTAGSSANQAFTAMSARLDSAASINLNGWYAGVCGPIASNNSPIQNYVSILANSGRITGGAAIISNLYGLYITTPRITGGGTVLNMYGVYQEDVDTRNYFNGVVGIGTVSVDDSAKLQINSTTQGVIFPRMTEAQRDLIGAPMLGLMVFNTTTNKLNIMGASDWEEITSV